MPKYIVSSEGPISVKEVPGLPDMPDWGDPVHPIAPPGGRPGHPIYPVVPPIPPRDEWPPLPPWLQPGVGLPIPPTPEHPMVPIAPGEPDGPDIWPPPRPEFPDMSGKSLVLALLYVSRHEPKYAWVVVDHEEVKKKWQAVKDKIASIPRPK